MAIRVSLFYALVFALSLTSAPSASQNPLNPSGFPLNPSKDTRLPPPLPEGEAERTLRIIRFETLEATPETLKGFNVEFELKGYHVRADRVEGNLQTQQFQLIGNVNLLGKDFVIRGEHLFVDFNQGFFRLQQGEMDLRPSLLQGRMSNDVYLSAQTAEVIPGEAKGHICRLTTCNYEKPHYQFFSRDVQGIADSKFVFKDIRLNVGNTSLFKIPQLVIPISREGPPITPEVGNARDEGYFLKIRYGIPVGKDILTLRGDLMSQRGIGLGIQYDYRSASSQGKASLYSDFSRSTSDDYSITASLHHKQDLPFGKLNFQHETRQFNYLTGTNTITHRSQAQLTFTPSPQASTALNFSRTQNVSPFSQSLQTNIALIHQQRWSTNHTTSLQLNWFQNRADFTGSALQTRENAHLSFQEETSHPDPRHAEEREHETGTQGSASIIKREAVDVRIRDRWEFPLYTAEINLQKQIPIGSTLDFFTGIERAPELILSTDRDKLFTRKTLLPFFLASFSIGNFIDHFTDKEIIRYAFDLRTRDTRTLTQNLNLNYDMGFQQGFYSDNTAQYTSRLNVLTSYKQSSQVSVNLRYHFQQSHGFTPLQLDRIGEQHTASLDAMSEISPSLKVGGQVGYDFNRQRRNLVPWQTPGIRLEYKPNDKFLLRAAGTYDAIQSSWSSIRMDASWKTEAFNVIAAARYDALRSRWANLNLLLNGLRMGRLKISTLLLYNGFLNRFDARHFSFTYDLHCAEAVLQIIDTRVGFRPGREVLFFIRLKAFPQSSPFGLGRLGEPLGPGTGWSG